MARVSFGSRAGDSTDYLRGNVSAGPIWNHGSCDTFDDLTTTLHNETAKAAQNGHKSCVTLQLSLRGHISLGLLRPAIGPYAEGGEQDLPAEFKTQDGDAQLPRAQINDIVSIKDPHARAIVQRAASRGVVKCIQGEDGFKYTFNNAWNSKDSEGSRFSYICQDSMQNKDRHANGFTKTSKHLKGVGERGPRKPTYDCKGSISVKFSSSKHCVEVYYRHYAAHTTVAERKPARVRSQVEPKGDATDETGADASSSMNPSIKSSGAMVPKKRKREAVVSSPTANQPPSLSQLLSLSVDANIDPPRPTQTSIESFHGPPTLAYDLPAWHEPARPTVRPPPPANLFPHSPYQLHAPPQQGQNWVSPMYSNPAPTPTPQNLVGSSTTKPAESITNAAGLFQTLKPTNPKPPSNVVHTYTPAPRTRGGQPLALNACKPCRASKIRCDENQPACGACQQRGKSHDCSYVNSTPRTRASDANGAVIIRWQPGQNSQLSQTEQLAKQTQNPPNITPNLTDGVK